MAISLITLLMGALASFTLTALTTTTEQRSRQSAAQIATSAMSTLRSIPATDIVTGRDATSVNQQFATAPAAVLPALASMTKVSDTSAAAGSGAGAVVSTSPVTQVLNGTTYSVNTYLGTCVMPLSGSGTDCVATGSGITQVRAVVAVTWKHRNCPSQACTYVSSTLVNQDGDPVFNSNTATPPTTPAVQDPGSQKSTVGGPVTLAMGVQTGTGVPTYTWQVTAGSLPVGLTMSASGIISGTPTVTQSSTPLTVTVTDAFGRTGSGTFSWAVVAAPTVTSPGAQSSTQGKSVTLPVTSTCPNSPCTFTLNNAPPGLSINGTTGVISGSPTTAGTYSGVTVTVTDAANVAVTSSPFQWIVHPAPTVNGLGSMVATVSNVKSVALSYTCPTASCTLTLTGTVPGLGLSATTPNTTNNTTTTLTVTSTSGTIYVAGTVQASAVPTGTSATYNPTVKITDGNGGTATAVAAPWVIYAKPSVAALGTRAFTEGRSPNVSVAYSCPSVPCTLTLAGSIPGLGLSTTSGNTGANSTTTVMVSATSGVVYVNGTVSNTAVQTGNSKVYTPTLTITDSTDAATSSSGTWTAHEAPKITNPGSQAVEPDQNVSIPIAATCPNGGCTYYADAQIGNDPTWYAIPISSTGVISYNKAPAGLYTIRVTVTDADGATDVVTFPLTVQTFTLTVPNQSSTRPATGTKVVTVDVAAMVGPQASGYTYTLSGQPSWLTVDANGLMTATLTPTSTSDMNITLTVTSKASATSTVADAFAWSIS